MSSEDIKNTLAQYGVAGTSLDRIRLARGVVGKASYVAATAFIALGAIAWSLRDGGYLIALAILVVFLFTTYLGGVLWFSNKHPGLALLEGAELIQWRKIEMAAKDVPALPEDSPPRIIGGE